VEWLDAKGVVAVAWFDRAGSVASDGTGAFRLVAWVWSGPVRIVAMDGRGEGRFG